MTTSKKTTATKQAKATKATAAPTLAKAKADTLRKLCATFTAAEGDRLQLADAQRRTVMDMAKVGDWEACKPIIAESMGALWQSDAAMRVSLSLLGRFWKITANKLAFPEVDQMGWQAYAKGPVAELLEVEGLKTVRDRNPQTPGGSKSAANDAPNDAPKGEPEARTIAKGAETLDDVLAVMAELANKASVLSDNKFMLQALATLKDDVATIREMAKVSK